MMRGVLENLLENAYRAGFQHGIIARRLDEPSDRRMRQERRVLAAMFYEQEKEFFNSRYQMREANQ